MPSSTATSIAHAAIGLVSEASRKRSVGVADGAEHGAVGGDDRRGRRAATGHVVDQLERPHGTASDARRR